MGSLLGACGGALLLGLAYLFDEGYAPNRAIAELPAVIALIMPAMFIIFLVIGWPLFFFLRGTRWFGLWLAVLVGIAVGLAASPMVEGPRIELSTLLFGATGGLASAVCWWFTTQWP
jgi:hypothetical protein